MLQCQYISFLISLKGAYGTDLTNEKGEVTSHLQGILYRSVKFLECGIKPIYVFDGRAPDEKLGELNKRKDKRDKNNEDLEKAKEEGDEEKILQFSKRSVRVTMEQNEECKKLLTLLGIPWIDAPSEAEAQCAELCKGGVVYASATEDMDTLAFGSPILVRNFNASESSKKLIREFSLEKVLIGLGLNMDEFLDMCILFGCDYCPTIKQIGAKTAFELIKKYRTIEKIVEKENKYVYPDDYLERVKITRKII